jgi:hypothetical protein
MDKRGMPCYLNTQNEKNIGLYGFCVVEQVRLQGTEILPTGMLGNLTITNASSIKISERKVGVISLLPSSPVS